MKEMDKLVSKTEYILRQARAEFKRPAVLWSAGKDSTCMLYLIKNTFMGKVPFPVVHLDTGKKFPEIYDFRDRISSEIDLDMIVASNKDAIREGVSPEKKGHMECCNVLKTQTLRQVVDEHKFDALIMSIRRDEHYMRNLERYFSPRDDDLKWHIVRPKRKGEAGDAPFESLQQAEMWELYQTDFGERCSHVRVHPILHWTEVDVWNYIKEYDIPTNPLYFSKNGMRYRTLGCMGCTLPMKSDAATIDEIITELKNTDEPERSGRAQDKEKQDTMRKLRALGYM